MSKLLFGALLLGGLAQASGCIITSDDDPAGRFSMGWILTAGGGEISCADAGAGGVASLATSASTGTGFEDIFTCEDGQGTTRLIPVDDYTVVVSVLDNNDAALGTSNPRQESIDVDGEVVDLGDFNFTFAGGAPGNLDFGVDYGVLGGSNCGGGSKGVEDQNTTLTVEGGGQCIPVALLLGGVQDVANICSEFPLCTEPNVVQTLPDLPTGDYDLKIEGLFDNTGTSVACYRSIDTFTIDGDLDLGVLVVPFDDLDDPAFCASI
jgi:hypothetical protein